MYKTFLLLVTSMLCYSLQAQNYIPFQKNGKWGFCDENKKQVIKPKYASVTKFNAAGFAIITNSKGLKGVINITGKNILPAKYSKVYFDAHQIFKKATEQNYYGDYGLSDAQKK